mmetsp:Transcript_848/g.1323  ORF Transcript_848/g.1323 Transcript_848/m.1323 type:complete len:399 (+) Transcript_848:2-1198(+)
MATTSGSTTATTSTKRQSQHQSQHQRERHFIFGYGSLICHRSRAITAPSLAEKPAEAVVVQHLTRTWSKRIHHQIHYNTNNTNCKKSTTSVSTSASASATSSTSTTTRTRTSTNTSTNANARKKRLDDAARELTILGQTAMGIERAINKWCNGVLIEVDHLELQSFDRRERGYDRVEINALHIWKADVNNDGDNDGDGTNMNNSSSSSKSNGDDNVHEHKHIVLQKASHKRYISSLTYKEKRELSQEQRNGTANANTANVNFDNIKVWVFLPQTNFPANRNFPIVQSYVDVILRGCLDYGNVFLDQFISTTHGWSKSKTDPRSNLKHDQKQEEEDNDHFIWVEDRDHPLYIRADVEWSSEQGKKLDEYLQESLPLAFGKRKPFTKILCAVEKDEEEFD